MIVRLKKISKLLALVVITLYVIVWLASPLVLRYLINNHALPKPFSLTAGSSIRYNPFTSHLSISNLTINESQQEQLLLDRLDVEIHMHQLMFKKIFISELTLDGLEFSVISKPSTVKIAGFDVLPQQDETNTDVKNEESSEPSQPFPYEIIIPNLHLTNIKIDVEHLQHENNLKFDSVTLSNVEVSQDKQSANLNINSSLDGAPINLILNTDLLSQQGNIDIDINVEKFSLASIMPLLSLPIKQVDGLLSYSAQHSINMSQEKTTLDVRDLALLINKLNVVKDDFNVLVEQQKITADNVAVSILADNNITASAGLDYTIESINAKLANETLANIESIYVANVNASYENNVPLINIKRLSIDNSQFSVPQNNEIPPLAVFKNLTLNAITATNSGLAINKVSLDGLLATILIDEDKNIENLIVSGSSESELQTDAEPSVEVTGNEKLPKTDVASEPLFNIRLDEFSLADNANIAFKDRSVTPNYERDIKVTTLSLLNVDSEKPQQETVFTMQGESNTYSTFDINASGLPFTELKNVTLNANIKELSLPSISSYIKDALQYEIESGQLDLTVSGKLVGSEVDGDLDLLMRGVDFTAADDHESGTITDQTSVPFNVALGMLKDSDGNVELSVPLTGDINAPSFGVSGFFTLIVKQATMSAAKDYLITTFVPYANVMSVAMAAGEYILKLRIEDMLFEATKVELTTSQIEFSRQMALLLNDKPDVNVKLCAIATSADLNLSSKEAALEKDNVERLRKLSEQRVNILKAHLVNRHDIPSSRLLICTPQVDTSDEGIPRIEFVI